MKLNLKEMRYVTHLAVWTPNAMALIEGCRFDNCYLLTETDVNRVRRLMKNDYQSDDHIVTLVRVAVTGSPPAYRRWQSFGADILRQWNPQESPPTMQELRDMVRS